VTPLRVVAHLRGAVASTFGRIALDALLMSIVAHRDGLPYAFTREQVRPVDIPIALSPCGRFYLCSFSIGEVEERERLTTYKRFPSTEAMLLGSKLNGVPITKGASKSYVMPIELRHMENDALAWFCVGDAEQIRTLLAFAPYVGKKRAIGCGPVDRWEVESCEAWEGFPVARDGQALRPLPLDHPGLVDPVVGPMALRPPYDPRRNPDRPLCAVPR
jgi:hypothetical protein